MLAGIFLSGLAGATFVAAQGGSAPMQVGEQKPHPYASECSQPHPFRPGERLVFRVIYFAMPAGTVTLEVKETSKIQGVPVYHFRAEAKSSAVFSLFYRVRDRVESFVDIANLLPFRFEKHLREGPRYKNDEITVFDRSLNIAESEGREMEIPEDTQDCLSSFYYLRVQPLEVGKSVFVDVNADEKNYQVEVKVLRKEVVKKWGKHVETIVVQPVIKDVRLGGILKQKGDVFIWLTADEKKIPVFIEAKVVVGRLSFVLVEYEEGETSGEEETS